MTGTIASESAIDAVDRLLDEVERALRRLDDGTYGSCAGCGGSIDDDRLALSPTAEECADCAAAIPAKG
jgi:RNA polymerase-binding transcription factor DksA